MDTGHPCHVISWGYLKVKVTMEMVLVVRCGLTPELDITSVPTATSESKDSMKKGAESE